MTVGLVLHAYGGAEAAVLDSAVRVARNAEADLTDCQIELVLQGPVVTALTDPVRVAALTNLVSGGVAVAVCANSLRSAEVPVESVPEVFDVVPAAVAHLARRQWEGWAYVRV